MIIFSTVLLLVIHLRCLTAREVPTDFVETIEMKESFANYEVATGSKATFRCKAIHDKSLDFTLSWKRNGTKIDFESEPRFVINLDYSLNIHNTNELDSGIYTCVAKTQIDEVEASTTLIVQDVPNAPKIIDVQCSNYATVKLMPMDESRAPILYYRIEYNTSFDPRSWDTINKMHHRSMIYTVPLSPWANYTFRVVAVNKIGPSKPSDHSAVCTTSPDVPYNNPDDVIGEGTEPDNLVISWTKMPQIEHNAPGFHYRVYWKQDRVGADYQYQDVHDWKTEYITIYDQPSFTRYLIKVVALNDLGEAKVRSQVVVGYSGELEPLLAPENFTLIEIPSPTSAVIGWNPVPIESIRGHFQAYKIYIWTENSFRHYEVILRGDLNIQEVLINNLNPLHKNFAQIYACNKGYCGPLSETIIIDTSKYVPDGENNNDSSSTRLDVKFIIVK